MSTVDVALPLPGAAAVPEVARRADPAALNARASLPRFIGLSAQLGVILAVFYLFDVEDPAFLLLSLLVTAAFAIHYWLPFAWKEPFWIAWSLGGAYAMTDPRTATLLIGAGFGIYALLAAPIGFRWRLTVLLALAAVLMYGRATLSFGVPSQFWPIFGAIFMFRLVIYTYDVAHTKGRPPLRDFLRYFFLLPNYYFLLFPVVDAQTLRRSYFRRDINDVAQEGLLWIARGGLQLLIYRVVYHWKPPSNAPEQVTTFGALVTTMVLTYLLYLRVSGQFHIIVGFLHLFGYDLPETHRRYLLAHSLTDFWRRINIYWKDFMVKVVYFPVYFRLRRSGDVRAQIVATMVVFLVTWLLHAYQWFWLRGDFLLTWTDTLFWAILGALVTVNLLVERRRPPARRLAGWRASVLRAAKVSGTFTLIVTLWSLWNAPSLREWIDLVTWWKVG